MNNNFDIEKLKISTNPEVKKVFNNYPDFVKDKILNLRKLIMETASEIGQIAEIEETLKWGEPSYLVKNGSTIRIDWKEKFPNQYAMYFKCTSRLVETFKKQFKGSFEFEGNRAIIFQLDGIIPTTELKKCIGAALQYHKAKYLPNLGM